MNATQTSRAILIALAMMVLATHSSAQVITGTILGTVKDPSGGAVPGAEVTITNVGTNVVTHSSSSETGYFTVPLLPPGRYEVVIVSAGFRAFRQSGITLGLDSKFRVEAMLEVGQVTEEIQVTAPIHALQTDSSDLNTTVTPAAIQNLPNIGRNPLNYVLTVPGVVPRQNFENTNRISTGDDSRAQVSNFTVNGSRPISSEILLDGAPNTGLAMNEVAILPNLDSVGELKVITNAFSAEFGRAAGGVVAFGTKAGGNEWHGSLYEYIRNPAFNANSYENNARGRKEDGTPVAPKGPFNLNQFGGTFSGPVVLPGYSGHDRTFFFVSYEGQRYVQDQSAFLTVPTELERCGDFSQTRALVRDPATGTNVLVPVDIYAPLPATTTIIPVGTNNYRLERQPFQDGTVLNKIPQRYLNPYALKLMSYYPLPNIAPQLEDGGQNYFDSNSRRVRADQISLRLDHNFSEKYRTFARYTHDWTLDTPPNRFREGNPEASNSAPTRQFNYSLTLGHTWTLSPSSIVDVRANATRINLELLPTTGQNADLEGLGFSPGMRSVAPSSVFPYVAGFAGYQSMGLGRTAVRDNHNSNFSLTGSYTKVANKWTYKFGGEYRPMFINLFQPVHASLAFAVNNFTRACAGSGCPTIPALTSQGHAAADFLIGNLDGFVGNGQFTTGDPSLALKFAYWALYTQNDWKVTSRLTLNLGLRWELQAPFTDRYDRLSQFNRPEINLTGTAGRLGFVGVGGNSRNQADRDWRDFGPRFGLAYRIADKTVIRAAYGITYDAIAGNGTGLAGFGTVGFDYPAYMRIRPEDGKDILAQPFNDAFNGGGEIIGPNPDDPRYLGRNMIVFTERNQRNPYIQQWNFTAERDLPGGFNAQVSYVGTKGTRLFMQRMPINLTNSIPDPILQNARGEYIQTGVNPLTGTVPNPFFGTIPAGNPALSGRTITLENLTKPYPAYGNIIVNNERFGSSSYHGLQVAVRRAFSNGFEVGGNYTWSKSIDFGNHFTAVNGNTDAGVNGAQFQAQFTTTNFALERSVSTSDIPHRAVLYYVLEFPFGKGKRLFAETPVVSQILGGWKVAGITQFQAGLPMSVRGGGFGRPDLVGDPVLPGECRGKATCVLPDGTTLNAPANRSLYFNPFAFNNRYLEVPVVGRPGQTRYVNDIYWYGTAPRTLSGLRGFGVNNTDLTLSREISLGENRRLEIRAEAMNVFNRNEIASNQINKDFGSANLDPVRYPNQPLGSSLSSNFGTSGYSSRRGQRYMQLSLRISF